MERMGTYLAAFLAVAVVSRALAAPPAAVEDIRSPVGMVYDGAGALYVAEWGAGRVNRFDGLGSKSP